MAMLLKLGDMLGLLWVLTLFDNSMKGLNVGNRIFYHVCHPKHGDAGLAHAKILKKSHTHTQSVNKVAIAPSRKTTS